MSDKKHWRVIEDDTVWDGFFGMKKLQLEHETYRGSRAVIEREVMQLGSAAAVLIHDPVLEKILLVEQFRAGCLDLPDGPWMTELVAGLLEVGESPAELVVREAQEEANVHIDNVRPIAEYKCSPGAVTQTFHLFYATADLAEAGGVYGLDSEGEDILVRLFSVDEALASIEQSGFYNAMTLIALQWFALARLKGEL